MRTFRVFVSSPGDVAVERRRAENVVSRLNGEFAGLARFETIRWETEYYRAHDTFQAQIPPAADCDIVVGILKWRLGTPLPPDFPEKLPDGEPYPSGTAYELLSAIDRRKRGAELPDVYVFRLTGSSPHPELDDPNRAAIERDWAALRAFLHRWFETPEGRFIAAFNPYRSEDDFEGQLEALLRKWCADKVAGGKHALWPPFKGSPFRGLDVFGAKHAPVFFGRSNDVRRAIDLWRGAAGKGAPFLLIVGASGSGKSSLARAGLIPRLTTPGVVAEVDAWRTAVMRPGDDPAGPFAVLAAALMAGEDDLPAEEEGRGPALPEIAEGDSKTPADLAAVLAHGDRSAVSPVLHALARVAERARQREQYGRELRCDLVLLIDQLEELFAPSIADDLRIRFAQLLAALAATGRVWIAATLRADLYAEILDLAPLRDLKERGAAYDLAPPGAAELAEIVRAPAAAAGLVYEADPATGERLDERLLREADRPDMLPLVQLALSRLYERREARGSETVLPFAAYAALGGLEGIIDEAGERALAGLDEKARERLPALIRQLAEIAHGAGGSTSLTIRAVPLVQAAPEVLGRRLVDALIAARLLTTSGQGSAVQLRLAHQRVLSDWGRARTIVAESGEFYRIRNEVEAQRRRWEGKHRAELLLPRGLPLAEAEAIAAKYPSELSAETLSFIAASRRRANRAQMIAWGFAALFAAIAFGALFEWQTARRETARADSNFAAAKQTIDGLIVNIAEGLRDVAGMRVETVRTILETVRATAERLIATAPNDLGLSRSRAAMWSAFSATYLSAGDVEAAKKAAEQSLGIMRDLLKRSDDAFTRAAYSSSLSRLGDVLLQAGDRKGAMAAYRESLDIDRALAKQRPDDKGAMRALSIALERMGDVELLAGDAAAALASFKEELGIRRALAAADIEGQLDLTAALDDVGNAQAQLGDDDAALASYRESLEIRRGLVSRQSDNTRAQRALSVSLEKIGSIELAEGALTKARQDLQQSLDIRRKLARLDPSSAEAERDLTVALARMGDVELAVGNSAAALSFYEESLAICRKLAEENPADARAQSDLAIAIQQLGHAREASGDPLQALTAYQQSLAIYEKLAADAGNAEAQTALANDLDALGAIKGRLGQAQEALASFERSLTLRRAILGGSPNDPQAKAHLASTLEALAGAEEQVGDLMRALAAVEESRDLRRGLVAKFPKNINAKAHLANALDLLGDIEALQSHWQQALTAYQEGLDLRRQLADNRELGQGVQRDLQVSLRHVAVAKSNLGDRTGALALYEESLALARQLAPGAADRPAALAEVAFLLIEIGQLKVDAKDLAGALTLYEEGLGLADSLSAAQAKMALSQLYFGFTGIGAAKFAVKDMAGALAVYEDAAAAARKRVALAPDDPQVRKSLFSVLQLIGTLKAARGDLRGALAVEKEAAEIAHALLEERPDAATLRSIAIFYGAFGDTQMSAGDFAAALAAYGASLDIVRDLAKHDQSGARRDLSIALWRLGRAKQNLGDLQGALAAYEEEAEVLRAVAAEAPKDQQVQLGLGMALAQIGDVKAQLGDRAAAVDAYQQALVIGRALAAQKSDDVAAQIGLAALLSKAAAVSPDPAPLYREALAILEALDRAGKLGTDGRQEMERIRRELAKLAAAGP